MAKLREFYDQGILLLVFYVYFILLLYESGPEGIVVHKDLKATHF